MSRKTMTPRKVFGPEMYILKSLGILSPLWFVPLDFRAGQLMTPIMPCGLWGLCRNRSMLKAQIFRGEQWAKNNPLCLQKNTPYGTKPPILTPEQLAGLREGKIKHDAGEGVGCGELQERCVNPRAIAMTQKEFNCVIRAFEGEESMRAALYYRACALSTLVSLWTRISSSLPLGTSRGSGTNAEIRPPGV